MTFTAPPSPNTRSPSVSAIDWAAQSNLTPAQRQLWLGQKLTPDSPMYNMAFLFSLSGKIDPGNFQAAFQALVQRCDALRTVITDVNGVPQQRVLTQLNYPLPVLDCRAEVDTQAAVRAWAEVRSQTPFKLSERLFDTALIQCGNNNTHWYLNQHHLITDMVSLKHLYDVMSNFYQRSRHGTLAQAPQLPAYATVSLPLPTARAVDYWQQQQISSSALYHRSAAQTSASSHRVTCALSPKQTAALKTLAVESEAAALTPQLSLFNLVAGIVLAYLHRISDSQQVSFSTPAQGRPSALLKETIGVFIELFPLQVEIDPTETFASLLRKVSEASGALLRHAQPGASEFAPNRDVNVVLNFLHAKVSDFARHPVRADWIHSGASDPHHHLRILVHDFDNRGYLQLHFDFNNDLFDPALQERAPAHFLALVDAVLSDRKQSIAKINLLNEPEKSHLDMLGKCPKNPIAQTVVQQFEAQVEKSPEAIALICNNTTLTYRQLNAKANQLAHSLQHQGIVPEAPVALCFHRSVEMLIAIWGVLKAGGAYVPIDPNYPKERISHILQDTKTRWVLTQSALAARLKGEAANNEAAILTLDTLNFDSQPGHNLPHIPLLDQLAYCLYTSGSTGQPKGVEIEHRSLANYVQWAQRQYVRERLLAFPLFSPLAFDLTVTSIYVPLLSGGQVVIYPEDEATIDLSLQRIFQDNAVDVIKLTPSHLALVQGMAIGSRVKTLILGGEDLKVALAREILNRAGNSTNDIELYNEYGPTEAAVGCMIQRFDPQANALDSPASVPIGRPAAGADIYLLDAHLNQVPWGDVGEIFIGGPGLARGYLNRPELSAERFVWRAGERLYRTGDLGRWEENGELTYLGRCDRQIKLHGIRIELGEIEAALLAHPQVNACVVNGVQGVDQSSPTQLVAYYVSQDINQDVSGAEPPVTAIMLRDFVAQRLPSSVRPAYFVALEKIPLTPNGKVDLSALPHPQGDPPVSRERFVTPQTSLEKTIAQMWQQVLKVEHIGIHDNFFDLGGDSIMAIQIAARMSEAGLAISPNQIFQQATVCELATVATSTHAVPEQDFFLAKLSNGQMDKLSALLDKADHVGGESS